jgi:hypothetical protein
MYLHGLTYGPGGRLYAAFTWRESNTGVLCNQGGLTLDADGVARPRQVDGLLDCPQWTVNGAGSGIVTIARHDQGGRERADLGAGWCRASPTPPPRRTWPPTTAARHEPGQPLHSSPAPSRPGQPR